MQSFPAHATFIICFFFFFVFGTLSPQFFLQLLGPQTGLCSSIPGGNIRIWFCGCTIKYPDRRIWCVSSAARPTLVTLERTFGPINLSVTKRSPRKVPLTCSLLYNGLFMTIPACLVVLSFTCHLAVSLLQTYADGRSHGSCASQAPR